MRAPPQAGFADKCLALDHLNPQHDICKILRKRQRRIFLVVHIKLDIF